MGLSGCLKSEELPDAIAPKGHWRLTGGATPGVRDPSPCSLLHPGGVQAIPPAYVFSSRFPLRPGGAQGKGGIPSLAGGHTPGYQPHAPARRAPSSSDLQQIEDTCDPIAAVGDSFQEALFTEKFRSLL